jgi:uncharacterized protein YegP (UPF0339 family)
MVIEVFKGESDIWFVRLVADNGETLMVSEGYDSKGNAGRAADELAIKINSEWAIHVHVI